MYLPPGWVFAEVNGMSGVNYGLVLPVLITGDCLHSCKYVSDLLTAQGKPNADLIAAIRDCKFKHVM